MAEEPVILSVDDSEIRVTAEHPFWVVGKRWVEAGDLQIGDELESNNKTTHTIASVDRISEQAIVYNFSVSDFHTYYATDLSILTHNESCSILLGRYASASTNRVTDVTGSNSKILRAELEAQDIKPPALSGDITGWNAHHIIPVGATNSFAKQARDILEEYEIDLNSASNGVYLPVQKGQYEVVIDGTTWATHNGGHTNLYYEMVFRELENVTSYDQEKNALQRIREDLMSGNLHIGKVK